MAIQNEELVYGGWESSSFTGPYFFDKISIILISVCILNTIVPSAYIAIFLN